MTLFEKITDFIRNTFDTLLYFAVMAYKEDFRNYILRAGTVGERRATMAVLGNGPALKEEMAALREQVGKVDFLAVNFFALDDDFLRLQPAYYVVSDPMFFRDSYMKERVEAFYRALNERVTWRMNLYVQFYNPEKFDYARHVSNPNIRIIPFHSHMYRGFRRVEFWLFRHGLGSANFGTVVQNGEYVAMQLGYRQIELYGVDHTLLEGLTVDDGNRLCRLDRHYYDKEAVAVPKPMFQKVPHRPYTMAEYLAEVAELFRGHEVLEAYARSIGVRIVNCTRGSMIDAYARRK